MAILFCTLSNKTGIKPEKLDKNRPIVCFGSFQDFLGLNKAGGIKAKNEWVHSINWDLVIFDEYHFVLGVRMLKTYLF